MCLERPAGEIPLEVAVIDGPGIALGSLPPEPHDERDRVGLGDWDPSQSVAEGGPDARRRISDERRG